MGQTALASQIQINPYQRTKLKHVDKLKENTSLQPQGFEGS